MSRESNQSADQESEVPELPTLVLGRPDSISDEELLKFVDGLAKALRELRENPKHGRDETLQIRADVFDAMIEQARAALPNECGGLLAGHKNVGTSRYPLRNTADFKADSFVHNPMSRLRFSLITLMGVVVVVAVGCAALRSASRLWASAIFTATLGLLSVALLGAVFLSGRGRAFCTGAVILGWMYVVLAFGPWFRSNIGNILVTTIIVDLIQREDGNRVKLSNPAPGVRIVPCRLQTQQRYEFEAAGHGFDSFVAANASDPSVVQATINGVDPSQVVLSAGQRPGVADVVFTDPRGAQIVLRVTVELDPERFRRIGHSLAALLAALMGGMIAWYFQGVRRSGPTAKHTTCT